jgi:hypothetical protein
MFRTVINKLSGSGFKPRPVHMSVSGALVEVGEKPGQVTPKW